MYDDIKEQFKSVIAHSQGIDDPKVDELFDEWAKAKSKFLKRFNGPIYEFSEVEFNLDDKEKKVLVSNFSEMVYNVFRNFDLSLFIDKNVDTFFDNRVSDQCYERNIPKDIKLIKAFKYFEPDVNKLRKIQDAASALIQENKVKGTLCFSVHPLDFLSSSENNYNWRSCHALNGEYRAGNLSYMVDSTTFMVYLKGKNDETLLNFGDVKWNSKKWRVLLHTTDDDAVIFASKQYPFSSEKGLNDVLHIYNKFIMKREYGNYYCSWRNTYIDTYESPTIGTCRLYDKYIPYQHLLYPLNSIVRSGDGSMNYNDILYSSTYKYPYYAMLQNTWSRPLQENSIVVGGGVKCLQCGKQHITLPESMRCFSCELEYGTDANGEFGFCDCCGRRVYRDDAYSLGYGEVICENCFNDHYFTCDCCGDNFHNSEKVYVNKNGEEYWYCENCYDWYKERKNQTGAETNFW